EIDAKLLDLNSRGSVRSCNYCHKIVNQYMNERNLDTNCLNKDSDFNEFREMIFSKSLAQNSDEKDTSFADKSIANPILSPNSKALFRRKSSIGFREEEYAKPKTRVLDIEKDAINKMGSPSPLPSLSSLGSYKTPFKGNDGDDDLMPLRSDETTHEPLWVKEINEEYDSQSFEKIDSPLELIQNSDAKLRLTKPSVSPTRRIAYSTSTYDIEMDFEKDRVTISRAEKTDSTEEKPIDANDGQTTTSDDLSVDFDVTTAAPNWDAVKDGTDYNFVYESLNYAFNQLYNKLLTQLLEEEGLSLSWLNVISRLTTIISAVVRPNSHNDVDEMDVRNYVKIKTIPYGVKNDCAIINGVVLTKNVSNRKMRQTIMGPKILLLSCSIVYQRYEKKLTILDTILLQEKEYIQNLIAKICAYGPDVVLVEKTVARIAKEMLLENGITLVCNVKPVIIERISRFTNAAIVSSLDAQIGVPQLGYCKKFYLQTFNQKTFMYFDGCDQQLGATVLLRGASLEELKKIKAILSFMVFCDFNWQLERSFLMDEYCYPLQSVDKSDSNMSLNNCDLKDSPPKERNVSSFLVDDNSDPLRSMASEFETNSSKESELLKVENTLNIRNREQSSPIESIPVTKHPFLSRNIKIPSNSHEIRSLIADFRANGPFFSHTDKRIEESRVETNVSENETKTSEQNIRIDALNPRFHQNLSVLFSSFSYSSANAPDYCVKPWIINMDFYGCNDIPLGGFLERYCFRPTYSCPSNNCSTPMIEHVRRFVHLNGCVLIVLRQLQQRVEAAQNSIITWSWCQKCKTGTPYSTLSSDSWLLSFGKYLELKFYAPYYRRRATSSSVACYEHSLHVDHFQFFAYKQIVASFKYQSIDIFQLTLPPTRVPILCHPLIRTDFIEDLKQIAIKGYEIYSSILEKLVSIKDETSGTKYEIIVNEFMVIESKERANFRQRIEEIQLLLTSCSNESMDEKIVHKLQDFLIQLKKIIAESVHTWNQKIQDFIANKKKEEKMSQKSGPLTSVPTVAPKASPVLSATLEDTNSPPTDCPALESSGVISRNVSISSTASLQSSLDVIKSDVNSTDVLKACIEEQEIECKETLKALETIKSDGEDNDKRQLETSSGRDRTLSVSSYGYEVDIGINNCLGNGVDFEASADNYAVYTLHDNKRQQEDNQSLRSTNETKSVSSVALPSDQTSFTVKRIFKELLTNTNILTINYPFPLNEHYILSTHKENIEVVVKDDDPASIISYALTSSEYERQLAELMRQSSSPLIKRKVTISSELEATSESKAPTNPLTQHIDIQYSDFNAKFYCCVYFADQFRKFRANVLDAVNGEELYIRSLSSSVPWKARGGKSGSTFCKSFNDRFILKEMTKLELQSFLNIANYYFDYYLRAISESKPTMLARIVGVYRTSYKNTATNTASKLYLLVMENLFYRCHISQKFDLKGSIRNRMVKNSSTSLNGEALVLLDENLMQMKCDSPLYIQSHSKAILRAAIDNDSLFLSSHSVMDYSLLVGIDEESKQFVVGIIDYIRPFTWDKKIESVVKSVGSQGKLPTIVQPDLYRLRFCDAMDQYFLCVPDKWYSIINY
ncbi:unnamed protein product, partial [Oppiella nova]